MLFRSRRLRSSFGKAASGSKSFCGAAASRALLRSTRFWGSAMSVPFVRRWLESACIAVCGCCSRLTMIGQRGKRTVPKSWLLRFRAPSFDVFGFGVTGRFFGRKRRRKARRQRAGKDNQLLVKVIVGRFCKVSPFGFARKTANGLGKEGDGARPDDGPRNRRGPPKSTREEGKERPCARHRKVMACGG